MPKKWRLVSKKQQLAETVAVSPTDQGNKARYSPAVLKISQEHGIDLTQVTGTGAGGRITRKDLLKLIESGNIPVAGGNVEAPRQPEVKQVQETVPVGTAQIAAAPKQSAPAVNIPVEVGDIEIPVTGIRKAIAANMLRSKHEAPHAWTMIEVDVTNLVEYRNSLKDDFKKKEGFNLTFFAFFVKAVAQALKEFPQINSMWAGDKIIQKKDINISIAVATDDALYVPVIKHADEKTIKGIAREITESCRKSQDRKTSFRRYAGWNFYSEQYWLVWFCSITGYYQLPASSDFTSRINRQAPCRYEQQYDCRA